MELFTRINNGYDTVTWDKMMSIKQTILRLWESAIPSVRISCIKFAQRVVLAQTVSSGADYMVCAQPKCQDHCYMDR